MCEGRLQVRKIGFAGNCFNWWHCDDLQNLWINWSLSFRWVFNLTQVPFVTECLRGNREWEREWERDRESELQAFCVPSMKFICLTFAWHSRHSICTHIQHENINKVENKFSFRWTVMLVSHKLNAEYNPLYLCSGSMQSRAWDNMNIMCWHISTFEFIFAHIQLHGVAVLIQNKCIAINFRWESPGADWLSLSMASMKWLLVPNINTRMLDKFPVNIWPFFKMTITKRNTKPQSIHSTDSGPSKVN